MGRLIKGAFGPFSISARAKMRWKITIEAWPYATGNGNTADQAAAGERSSEYVVTARDIKSAMAHAESIQSGIRHNPAVWEAPIVAIVRCPD